MRSLFSSGGFFFFFFRHKILSFMQAAQNLIRERVMQHFILVHVHVIALSLVPFWWHETLLNQECMAQTDLLFPKNVKNFNGGRSVRIENSVTRASVQHHEACRVMPNSYPEWRNFQFAPNNHYRIFFLHTLARPLYLSLDMRYFLSIWGWNKYIFYQEMFSSAPIYDIMTSLHEASYSPWYRNIQNGRKSRKTLPGMQEYNDLSCMWDADRNIRSRVTVCHSKAMPRDAKQWPEGQMLLSATNSHDTFFFLHTFGHPAFDFSVGVAMAESHSYTLTSTILKVDVVCDATMTSTPNVFTTKLRDIL